MPRIQESFVHRQSLNNSIGIGGIAVALIVFFSVMSIGLQTISIVGNSQKQTDKKSTICLKQFKDNDCNAFSPSEKCKPIIQCIKSIDEPFWNEIISIASTGFQQIEKLSIIPLVIVGLIIINKKG